MSKKISISEIKNVITNSINEEMNNIVSIKQNENVDFDDDYDFDEDIDGDKIDDVFKFLFHTREDLSLLVSSLRVDWENPTNKKIYDKLLKIVEPMYEEINNITEDINSLFD